MRYLTRDDLLDLHMVALERYEGRMGIRSQDRLLACVSAPQQVMFDAELYPDLPSKVAILGFMVLKNRPFNGGNEATALLAMLRMIEVNACSYDVFFPQKLALVLQSVLHSELDRDELTGWLRDEISGPTSVAG